MQKIETTQCIDAREFIGGTQAPEDYVVLEASKVLGATETVQAT